MLQKFLGRIEKAKPFVEKILPWFFLVYFILVFAPYISAKVPALNSFFTNGTTKLIYRGFTCILFGVFSLLLWAIYKPKFKWWAVIGCAALFVIYVISVAISPTSMSYVILNTTMKVNFFTLEIGNYSYIIYTFSFLADLIFFFLFISFIPVSIRKASDFYPTLFFIIGVMIICCAYSFLTERNSIIKLMNGASEYDVSVNSLFHNKNTFGLYLFIGSFASSFIFFTCTKKWQRLVVIPHILFIVMSFLILCKSSFVSNVILLIGCIVYFLFVTLENKPKASIVTIAVVSSLAVLFLIFMLVPQLHVGPLEKVYDDVQKFFIKIFGGLTQRADRWGLVKYVVTGPYKAIGANDTYSAYGIDAILRIERTSHFTDFHSGYVSWYASHGILGSIIYFGFFIYLFVLISKVIAVDKKNGILILVLYVSSLIFIVPESYTLFVSISSYAYLLNLILIGYTYSILNKHYPQGIWKSPKELEEVAL